MKALCFLFYINIDAVYFNAVVSVDHDVFVAIDYSCFDKIALLRVDVDLYIGGHYLETLAVDDVCGVQHCACAEMLVAFLGEAIDGFLGDTVFLKDIADLL